MMFAKRLRGRYPRQGIYIARDLRFALTQDTPIYQDASVLPRRGRCVSEFSLLPVVSTSCVGTCEWRLPSSPPLCSSIPIPVQDSGGLSLFNALYRNVFGIASLAAR